MTVIWHCENIFIFKELASCNSAQLPAPAASSLPTSLFSGVERMLRRSLQLAHTRSRAPRSSVPARMC